MVPMAQVSQKGAESLAEIIKAASSSPLGIFALMIVAVSLLAFYFFRSSPLAARIIIFVALLAGTALYGLAITRAAQPNQVLQSPNNGSLVLEGIVEDSDTSEGIAGAEITVDGGVAPEISDTTGRFTVNLKMPAAGGTVKMRVTKDGYNVVTWDVTLPLPTPLAVPLAKSHPRTTDRVVAGMVVDEETNQGIGQATITAAGRTDEYLTEDSGNFRIIVHGEAPGRLRIHVSKSGFRPLDTSVEPPAENLVWQLRKQ